MTLREHMEFAVTNARKIFTMQGGLAPMIHAIDEDGQHHIVQIPQAGGNDQEKDVIAVGVRQLAQEKNFVQMIFISEAWVIKGKDRDKVKSTRPSQHPDRIEVLVFQGEDAIQSLCAMVEIKRHKTTIEFGPVDIWTPSTQEGRFASFLPKKGAMH